MRRTKIILILILFLAGFLRFYQLADYPVGFHLDEATLGYNAYSLLKTARDEGGNFLSLHTDMFGDHRPTGYRYLAIPSIKFFGLNEFATRFPSAVFGTLNVVVIFLLINLIFDNSALAVIGSLLMAISPWHITFSRSAAETNLALFFATLGVYFFLAGIVREKGKSFLYAVLAWVVSLLIYHSPRVFVPMMALSLAVFLYPFWQKKKKSSARSAYLSALIISGLALLLVFSTGVGTGRFEQVSIFHFPEVRLVMEEQIREDTLAGLPVLLTRAFHNKIINYTLSFVKEYFNYFSLNYLFIEGGLPPWYLVPRMGLMLLVELPFFFLGLLGLIYKSQIWQRGKKNLAKRFFLVPLVWLLLGPIAAAVTRDDVPNVLRSLPMQPALVMITAFGLGSFLTWFKKGRKILIYRGVVLIIVLLFAGNFAYFLHQYFVHARVHRPWYRFNGFKELVLAVNEVLPDYDKVIISKVQGGIYMHFLFFNQFDPVAYQKLDSPQDKAFKGFGKFIFVPQDCLDELPAGLIRQTDRVLWAASGNCDQPQFLRPGFKEIKREDNTVVFRLGELSKDEEK